MSNFLLEIGTEELPADFARLVVPQFKELIREDLHKLRLEHGDIFCSSTPRRITVIVKELAKISNDFIEDRKGPPAFKAFENGSPTQSAIGFANRYGIALNDLEIRDTPKGKFVFGKVVEKGESAFDLMGRLIIKWIKSLQGSRFMRWGMGDLRFSRPIRWIVSMIDDKEITLKISDSDPHLISGRLSRGHRLFKKEVLIHSANDYIEVIRNAGVIVSRKERAELIKSIVEESSSAIQARADLSEKLLDELTDLVESPSLIRGEFDKAFLDLPSEVLSTVMQVHQRYIPLYRMDSSLDPLALNSKGILIPYFFCIANGLSKSNNIIKEGNERVLKARFADARFFINADLASSSSCRREQLKKVTFADGLGSLFDRVKRVEWLTELFLINFPTHETNADTLRRAAKHCKNDLVSQIVGEFPELQGIMGAKYLIAEGESDHVALAVLEQYLPRGYGDDLPKSFAGSALAFLERLELLLSIFSKGLRPSGSSDPYALRRAGNGILQIIWNQGWAINLLELLDKSVEHWGDLFPNSKSMTGQLIDDLTAFLHQRIFTLLEEFSFDSDLIQAVSGETIKSKRLLSDPCDAFIRVSLLSEMRKTDKLAAVQSVVNRASRLAQKGSLPLDILSAKNIVNQDLFEKSSEKSMLEVVNSLEPICMNSAPDRYQELANGLASGAEVLSEFFDGENSVMVMSEDEKVRNNRLNLLSVLRNQALLIADFNQIVN